MRHALPVHPTLTHPLTGLPLRAVFVSKTGRVYWPIIGAAPEGDDAAAQAAADAAAKAAADTAAADAAKAAAAAQGAKAAEWDGKIESLPDAVQKLIADARAEAGKARTTAKETAAQEARDELLKKLGLTKDGEPVRDADALAKELADKDSKLADLTREREAEKAARKHSGDVDAMLDSRAFKTSLDLLDPAADDFTKKVDALVEKTLKDNPKFKTAQAAGVSGGNFAGGAGENGKARPTSLGSAIAAAITT